MQLNIQTKHAFTVKEFCKSYAIGRTTAYEEIKSGRLQSRKVGRRTLILRIDADNWLADLPAGGPQEQAA